MALINMTSKNSITLKTAGKYCDEDITIIPTFGNATYVLSTPVEFVLSANKWNGTIYKIEDLTEYGAVGELQLGIPTSSSIINARILEQCALTIAQIENFYTKQDLDGDGNNETSVYADTTITISAVTTPTEDVTVAIWGLIK